MTTILEFPVPPVDRDPRLSRVWRSSGPVWIHHAWIQFTADDAGLADTALDTALDTAVVRRAA